MQFNDSMQNWTRFSNEFVFNIDDKMLNKDFVKRIKEAKSK